MIRIVNDASSLASSNLPFLDLGAERRTERSETFRRSRRLAIVLSAIVATAFGGLLPATVKVLHMRADLAALQAQAAREQTEFSVIAAKSAAADQGAALWEQYRISRQRREAWRDIVPAAVACMPGSILLTSVETDNMTAEVIVKLRGTAEDSRTLNRFADALDRTPFFEQVRVIETAIEPSRAPSGIRFGISARIGGALSTGAVVAPH